ncbi:carbon-nitrogen hydrolase family protein [Lichenihabitans sp. Uapishka_5]|uniref:carbon-nitrogen hydrolase family protein n=1 Tax=Lichenihabitans sp. Uapishka_5 TaxID=3037302 RepID=UPI0029E7F90A|nr:carbon-nitrogen hydrolase family protein [Lichenihabitans sp. Uapishka_5]MDX7954005.1 carbon-nitrogen hydrolase family protein [Lichenihabitans sp. Uapishka_5]
MKVALIQMNSGPDKAANLAAAERLIDAAVAADAPDWICLPECFDHLGGTRDTKRAAAEAGPDGPASRLMQTLARKHRVFIHAGSMLERIPDDARLHNTTLAFDRDGQEVARYRKIHMFDITAPDGTDYKESATFKRGEEVVTYACEGVTVGCAICYDLRFPALFQALADRGATLIALPAAFTLQTGKDHWEVLCRARAIETETYVCAAAQTGSFPQGAETRHTYGHSLVADPWGHVVARASDGVGWTATRIDPARVASVRAMIPVAKHRVRLPEART